MGDDAETPNGVDLLNAALDGLCDVMVGLHCLSHDADYIYQHGVRWDHLFGLNGDFYGLGWRPNNFSDAKQQPRGLWLSDWYLEVISWLRSEGVETDGLSSDEIVAAASKKLGGWEWLLRPGSPADDIAKAAGAAETLKYIPKHVECLRRGQAKADKSIQAFPEAVLTALDGLRGKSWRARLRSEILNIAGRWPGTKGQGMSACYVPVSAKAFISLVGERDPRGTWARYIDLVEDARADILAAAGELPKEEAAAAQPSESPHAVALRQLAAEAAAERERSESAKARAMERYNDYFKPYDAIWLDLVHAKCNPAAGEPLDPDWLLERLTTLVARARELDQFDGGTLAIDRLGWLHESPPAVENPVAKAFALAMAAATDGSLSKDDAAAVCGMLESHPGNELNSLYRAYPEGDDSPRFEPIQKPSAPKPQDPAPSPPQQRDGSAEVAPTPIAGSGPTASLLLTSLNRLRDRFASGAEKYRKLPSVLIHRDAPSQRIQPKSLDALSFGLVQMESYHGPTCPEVQLRGRSDFEAVVERPFYWGTGEPITNAAGEAVPFSPAWERTVGLYRRGDDQPADAESRERFGAVAEEAGAIVTELPRSVSDLIWREWPDGLYFRKQKAGTWLTAVFELAWQGHRHSGLSATRRAWLDRTSADIELLEDALDGKVDTPQFVEFAKTIGFPRACWFSEIENVWQASIAAVDLLISLLSESQSDDESARRSKPETPPPPEVSEAAEAPYSVDTDLNRIWIGNKSHDVPAEAARMAKLLLEAHGEWVPMAKNDFTKPSDTKKLLPAEIQAMIETGSGKGYRLRSAG